MSAAMVVPLKLTREQFAALPEPEHGGKMELVGGRLVIMTPVGPEHGKRANRIGRFLDVFAEENDLGSVRSETGYWLSRNTMRAPDISFVTKAHEATETIVAGAVSQPPDLAIEVASPSNTERELSTKVRMYLAAGVAGAWVVRPDDQTITVYRGGGESRTLGATDMLTSDDAGFPITGFSLLVGRVFER